MSDDIVLPCGAIDWTVPKGQDFRCRNPIPCPIQHMEPHQHIEYYGRCRLCHCRMTPLERK